ncbi:MAG: hypothetical protein ACXVH7_07480 [Thermoanaerobaculia bacterium]
MKRAILLLGFLLAAAPAFAVNRTVIIVDDVIKMTKAGVADDEIIAFVTKYDAPFDVNGDDVIAMNDAHVSPAVLKFMIDESAARMRSDRREPVRERVYVARPAYYGYYDPFWYGYGYGYPYGYPYGYYDPFWYGPRVSIGFGFGPRFGFRGGFRHGHH